MNTIFYTFPLGLVDWEIILTFAFIPLIVGELTKVIMAKIEKKAL